MRGKAGSHGWSVPVLSVSLNTDPKNYTSRLIRSIDYPVDKLFVQIGNADKNVVNMLFHSTNASASLNPMVRDFIIVTLPYNPGSSKGFNFGLKAMSATTGDSNRSEWVLVVNNDIAFYPGVLKKIAKSTARALHHNDTFGVGFTSLCCGSEWSAVVFTERLVSKIGYFDENFYPAYYEDDDYGIRIHLSNYKAMMFENTPLLHGEIDGSKDYLSGIFVQLYFSPAQDAATNFWRKSHEAGVPKSKAYIEAKWGIQMGDFKDKHKLDCKSIIGLNELCAPSFIVPFNNHAHNISQWVMLQDTEERIQEAATHIPPPPS